MEALQDLFLRLAALSHVELMLGLLLTGTVILVLEDWRLKLWALMAQYVLVGLLLVRVMPLRVALIEIVVGGLVCLILYLTAQRVHWGREGAREEDSDNQRRAPQSPMAMGGWFRLAAALLAAVVTYALGTRHPFVEQPQGISQASYWLVVIGLLAAVLSRSPFKVGLGLLTFQAGFGILLATFEASLSVTALLGVTYFLTALAVAYLTSPLPAFVFEDDGE
jgi:hypothetical protein